MIKRASLLVEDLILHFNSLHIIARHIISHAQVHLGIFEDIT